MKKIFYYYFLNSCFSNTILVDYGYDLFSFEDNKLNLKFYSALDFNVFDFSDFYFDIGVSFLLFCDFLFDKVYYNIIFFRFLDSCFVKFFPIFNFIFEIFFNDFYFINFGVSISPYFIKFIFQRDCKFFKVALCVDCLKKNIISKEFEVDDLKVDGIRDVCVNSELIKREIEFQRKNFVISSCFRFIKDKYIFRNGFYKEVVDQEKDIEVAYNKFFIEILRVVIQYIDLNDFKSEENFTNLVSSYCSKYSIFFDLSFFKDFYQDFYNNYLQFCSVYNLDLFFNKNSKKLINLNILESFPDEKEYMASDVFDILNYFSSSIYLDFDSFVSYDLFYIKLLTELGFSGLICDKMNKAPHFLVIEYFKSDSIRVTDFSFSYMISAYPIATAYPISENYFSKEVGFNSYNSLSIIINNFKEVSIQKDGWSCGYFSFLANLFARILDVPIEHSYTLLYIFSKEKYFKLYSSVVFNLLFFYDFKLFLDAKIKIFELLYLVNRFDGKYGDLFLLNRIKIFMVVSEEREAILNLYKKNSNLWMKIYNSNIKVDFGCFLRILSLDFYTKLSQKILKNLS